MTTDSHDQPTSYKEFAVLFGNAISREMSTNAFIFRSFAISLFIMFFGILLWCIFAGLFLGLEIIAFVFDPAYQLFRKILHLQNVPPRVAKPPVWRYLITGLFLIFPAIFILIGVRGLSVDGFCPQSIACMLITIINRFL